MNHGFLLVIERSDFHLCSRTSTGDQCRFSTILVASKGKGLLLKYPVVESTALLDSMMQTLILLWTNGAGGRTRLSRNASGPHVLEIRRHRVGWGRGGQSRGRL